MSIWFPGMASANNQIWFSKQFHLPVLRNQHRMTSGVWYGVCGQHRNPSEIKDSKELEPAACALGGRK